MSSDPSDAEKPRVVVFATGGTIAAAAASSTGTSSYDLGAFNIESLLAAIPEIKENFDIAYKRICNIGSPDINAKTLIDLSQQIQRALLQDEIDGVVVTHGTDTMEETAFFLDLTIQSHKPVVVVGAMRPATAKSADGPMNLMQAISVAGDGKSRRRGVMIVMNDLVLSPRFATKTSANSLDSFQAGLFGCLGIMQDDEVIFLYDPQRPLLHQYFDIVKLDPKEGLPNVSIIYGHLDLEKALIAAAVDLNAQGIVLAGMGAGCWTTEGGDKIHALLTQRPDVLVVASFRTLWGYVNPSGDIYGLKPVKGSVVGSGHLNPPKARIQLQLCLATGATTRDGVHIVFAGY